MQETRITKRRIQNHFTYSWWKYILLICVAIFGWNLVYTSTAYRAPRDKRLDITFVTYAIPDETLSEIREDVLARYPEVEDSSVLSISYSEEDSYYGSIQLTTYMGAGEGDIYILSKDRFDAFASSGAFIPLDDAIESGELDLHGIDPAAGIRTDEEGNRAIYGIPAKSLYGMMDAYYIDNRDLYITVVAYSPNVEKAIDWIGWLIETMEAPKPQWLVDQEAEKSFPQQGISDIPSY